MLTERHPFAERKDRTNVVSKPRTGSPMKQLTDSIKSYREQIQNMQFCLNDHRRGYFHNSTNDYKPNSQNFTQQSCLKSDRNSPKKH